MLESMIRVIEGDTYRIDLYQFNIERMMRQSEKYLQSFRMRNIELFGDDLILHQPSPSLINQPPPKPVSVIAPFQ